jgi:hypothetical protein
MRDKQLKSEEVESSHTLGGTGKGFTLVKGSGEGDRVCSST